MNTLEILGHLLSRAPWVDRTHTVDTVKAGDPTRPLSRVAVGWIASIENLRQAEALGCELFITHEPTFWEHSVAERKHRKTEPGLTKQRLLERTGMVVLRVHDIWDRWPGIGIRDAWAAGLELRRLVGEDPLHVQAVYRIEEMTLKEFAQAVARRVRPLGQDSVQVIGDPNQIVRRPAVGTGCIGPDTEAIALGADVLIVCYDGATYWRDRERFAELGVGVITVEHGTSEMWGVQNLARYLQQTFPMLTVHYLDRHARPWTVGA